MCAASAWDYLQGCDPVAIENEEVAQVDGTAREVAAYPAGDHYPAFLVFAGERHARIRVLQRGILLPLLDGGQACIHEAFVLHDSAFRKASRDSITVALVCVKICANGLGEFD